MAFGSSLAPFALIIWFALYTTEALALHGRPLLSLSTPQLTARAEQAATIEPYTGNGAV